MSVFTRHATLDDAAAMCDLINPIIAEGTTTANRNAFDPDRMKHHYLSPPRLVSCMTAWNGSRLLGFQTVERPDPDWDGADPVPSDWALIATFVAQGTQGQGVGQSLFSATLEAVRAAAIPTIDATIRADNKPGLAYYSRVGFVDYGRLTAVPLSDGTLVDRIRKRYDVAAQI